MIKKITPQKAEGSKEEHRWDFWTRETTTGEQVAQLLDCYILMMMTIPRITYIHAI
jgi:hypothetical protein